MRKFTKALTVMVAVVAILAAFAVPASALSAGLGAFKGTAQVTKGLWSPVSPFCGLPLCPGATNPPATTRWNFTPDAFPLSLGVASSTTPGTNVAVGGLSGAVAGDLDSGTFGLGAWCGYSSGRNGAGTVTVGTEVGGTAAISSAVSKVRWYQSAATVIVFEGQAHLNPGDDPPGADPSAVAGVVSAIPPLPGSGQSCILDGTAQTFTIVGAVALYRSN
jgi:hypothetical protein